MFLCLVMCRRTKPRILMRRWASFLLIFLVPLHSWHCDQCDKAPTEEEERALALLPGPQLLKVHLRLVPVSKWITVSSSKQTSVLMRFVDFWFWFMFLRAGLSEIPWKETMENGWLWTWYENLFSLFRFCCSSSFFLRQRSNFFKTLEPSVLAELPRLATFIEDRSMNLSKNISTAAQHDRLQNPWRDSSDERHFH